MENKNELFKKYYWLKSFLVASLISLVVISIFFVYTGSFSGDALLFAILVSAFFGAIYIYFKHFYHRINSPEAREREKESKEKAKIIEKKEIEYEATNYASLGIKDSSRGRVAQATVLLFLITAVLAYNRTIPLEQVIFGLVVYIPLAVFVYRGSRMAMYIMMFVWSLEKIFQIAQSGGKGFILILLWWLVLGVPLFRAIQVENERRKKT